jgi:hypothetical protein
MKTNGECKSLDINSNDGSETLTNVVTTSILKNIGKISGKGNALIQAYEAKFIKGHI